mgnify:FL=1
MILKESADVNLFLGDLCGYYFDEFAVWEKLRTIPRLIALKGNHDEMFLSAADGNAGALEESSAKYGPAIKFFLNKNHTDMIAWIKKLPSSWEGPAAICGAYHGSPWDVLKEYIYPDASLKRFRNFRYPWVFLGHTHYPMDRSEGVVRIINPGSLGQPRDGHWPQFAVVDFSGANVRFREVQYDKDMFVREMRRKVPENHYLYDVIERVGLRE